MCVPCFAGQIPYAKRWPGPQQSLSNVILQWLTQRQENKLVEKWKACQDAECFCLCRRWESGFDQDKRNLKGSLFLRNTGMSPSQLNFLLKMTEKRTLQNQLALSVRLKLWRRRASLRMKMRRIYLQSLKRGDSCGRRGSAFFQNSPAVPSKPDALKHIASVVPCYCCWGGSRGVGVGGGRAALFYHFCICGGSFCLPPLNWAISMPAI